jgi:hypothetical protein
MRWLARWSVVIAFICTVVLGGATPLFDRTTPAVSTASASGDGSASGFTSEPAPEAPAYVGPGIAISGSTIVNPFTPSSSLAAWRQPSRAMAAPLSAIYSARPAPHLRSIPLLI